MTPPERAIGELFDLRGRVAIVTGACGWLGSAMSRALAEAGDTSGYSGNIIIMAHLGHPWQIDTCVVIRKHPNLYAHIEQGFRAAALTFVRSQNAH